ncbi:hypothetical protein [Halomonas sp. 11-S5]|uniref:hypothetical protein n=1 Tax=Halomonas sp. 11-S5 TaxID=2994064 RepID=UPI0024689517|nr:hypothetical protein [Halomonas sp. 11-S5]
MFARLSSGMLAGLVAPLSTLLGHIVFGLALLAMTGIAQAGSSISSAVVSSAVVSSASGEGAVVEAVLTGHSARVAVNGDRVERYDGRLIVNGVSYGTVDAQAVVRYRVRGDERTVLVDDLVRAPAE